MKGKQNISTNRKLYLFQKLRDLVHSAKEYLRSTYLTQHLRSTHLVQGGQPNLEKISQYIPVQFLKQKYIWMVCDIHNLPLNLFATKNFAICC